MRRTIVKYISAILLVFILLFAGVFLTGCGGVKKTDEADKTEVQEQVDEAGKTEDHAEDVIVLRDLEVAKDDDYGEIKIMISDEDFTKAGFELGDSVNVEFSNGHKVEDLPYYNGYYVLPGEMLLLGKKGGDHERVSVNYGDGTWDKYGLSEEDTAVIILNEKGKYLNIQQCCNLSESPDRSEFSSDEVFANFRDFSLGHLKENTFYRSASPCNNKYNRAAYVDDLIEEAGIGYIVNLADNEDEVKEYMSKDDFNSPYFESLYKDGKVIMLDMDMNYPSEAFREKLVEGLRSLTAHQGPYLIHCTQGKDRTGFACMLLEALAGASYDEIVDDYMKTYDNYYGIDQDNSDDDDSKSYEIIKACNIDPMLAFLEGTDTVDTDQKTIKKAAEKYLKDGGMTDEEISAFK